MTGPLQQHRQRRGGRRGQRACVLIGAALAVGTAAAGCSGDNDACSGRSETCLSLTLSGADGVAKVDQVQVYVARKAKTSSPVEALSEPRELPFKVALLWPDGPATLHVRTFLQGQLNGLTPEISLDLRNGTHDKRKLTLYPPLTGTGLPDLGMTPPPDMTSPRDMANPADMATPPDMDPPDMDPPDMSPDMSPADLPAPPSDR